MIKNEKQFRNTTSLIKQLQDSLFELSGLTTVAGKEWLRDAQKQALEAQILQLREQAEAYLAVKTRKNKPKSLSMVRDLPSLLIQWRIYKGLSQKQLSEKLGWHYQQLQDYEKSDYASATWHTIKKVVDALSRDDKMSNEADVA